MDVKNLIIDKYTNNVTTVDEISDTFPHFTKTENTEVRARKTIRNKDR